MKCPRDGTVLAPVTLIGIELDKCHKCDGIWFDQGELERIRDAKLTEAETVLENKFGSPAVAESTTDGYMQCPRCEGGRLQRSHYTYLNPVKVDRCDKCYGIWLDQGELRSVVGEKQALDAIEEEPAKLRVFLRSLSRAFRD